MNPAGAVLVAVTLLGLAIQGAGAVMLARDRAQPAKGLRWIFGGATVFCGAMALLVVQAFAADGPIALIAGAPFVLCASLTAVLYRRTLPPSSDG